MALIDLNTTSPEQIEEIRKEYKLLQAGTIACVSSGFVILLAAPFVVPAKSNPILRYASLFTGLVCSSVGLATSKRLEEIEPVYLAISKGEKRVFIDRVATSEMTITKLFLREANRILKPLQPVPETHSLEHSQPDSQHSQNHSQDDSQPSTEDNSQDSQPDSQRIANESAIASIDQPTDQRTQRLELLRQLKNNRRTKAQMIERLWNVTESSEQFIYYLQMLEEMLAELKRLDGES